MTSLSRMTAEEVKANPIRLMFKELYQHVTKLERKMLAAAAEKKTARAAADDVDKAEQTQDAKVATPKPKAHWEMGAVRSIKLLNDSASESDGDSEYDSEFDTDESYERYRDVSLGKKAKPRTTYNTRIYVGPQPNRTVTVRVADNVVYVDVREFMSNETHCIHEVTLPDGYNWEKNHWSIDANGLIRIMAPRFKRRCKPTIYREFSVFPVNAAGERVHTPNDEKSDNEDGAGRRTTETQPKRKTEEKYCRQFFEPRDPYCGFNAATTYPFKRVNEYARDIEMKPATSGVRRTFSNRSRFNMFNGSIDPIAPEDSHCQGNYMSTKYAIAENKTFNVDETD